MRQGAHHVAQKSTTARPLCCSICASKSESFTSTALDIFILQTAGYPAEPRSLAFTLLNKFNDPINPAWNADFPHWDRRGGDRGDPPFFPGGARAQGGRSR